MGCLRSLSPRPRTGATGRSTRRAESRSGWRGSGRAEPRPRWRRRWRKRVEGRSGRPRRTGWRWRRPGRPPKTVVDQPATADDGQAAERREKEKKKIHFKHASYKWGEERWNDENRDTKSWFPDGKKNLTAPRALTRKKWWHRGHRGVRRTDPVVGQGQGQDQEGSFREIEERWSN